jgi:poly-gamma-glutamate capsule biosynthesis protein CapA/YwtB (metallophosphatase superfamily)
MNRSKGSEESHPLHFAAVLIYSLGPFIFQAGYNLRSTLVLNERVLVELASRGRTVFHFVEILEENNNSMVITVLIQGILCSQ